MQFPAQINCGWWSPRAHISCERACIQPRRLAFNLNGLTLSATERPSLRPSNKPGFVGRPSLSRQPSRKPALLTSSYSLQLSISDYTGLSLN